MRLSLSLLLCLLVSLLRGQAPVADFKANVVSGCSPLAVSFTDQSTGNPVSWNWDFGNGLLSNAQNPTVSFAPGTYSVTLVVRNANGINQVTKTNYIVSNPSPSVEFAVDKTISCLPATIQLTDQSAANAGTINKWDWDFGDGSPRGTTQNPSHTYSAPGYYDIYLKVTSTTGCSEARSKTRLVRIVNGVKADFSTTGPSTCAPPYSVTFNNLTSGPGNLSYSWDLGNSVTSTQTSPVNAYASAGNYSIKLLAKSDFGCTDTISKTIPINGSTSSFSLSRDSTCLGSPVSFTASSSPAPVKVFWKFGDGSSSTQLNPPAKIYANPGTYPVTLYSTFAGCMDSVTKNVTVFGKPAVSFYSPNSNSFCKAPTNPGVIFQNNSPDVATAKWNFGDGNTANSVGTASVTHVYNTTGNFNVTLTITDSKGCTNSVTLNNYVNVLAPAIAIGGVPGGLCKLQTFSPFFNGGTVDGIATYAWDFGDGQTSAAATPVHFYTVNGNYTVRLTITTNGGCTTSVTAGPITVGDAPVVDFDKNAATVCHSTNVIFTNLSTPLAGSKFLWDFGDGTIDTLKDPPHKFLDTGMLTIKLKVTTKEGCADSLSKPDFIQVLPPIANFGYTVPDCTNKNAILFSDSSINNNVAYGLLTYKWDFGDSSPTDATTNPSHVYPTITAYNVKLTVNNSKCTDSIIKIIKLVNETADFTFNKTPATYCRNENVIFTSVNPAANIKKYEWIVDGAAPVNGTGTYNLSFTSTGNHTIQLIITDINNCISASTAKPFVITGPTALFGVNNNSTGGCSKTTITFTDSSFSPGTITSWVFDFGDGTGNKNYSAPPFTHIYADTGNFVAYASVNDNLGCSDTYKFPGGISITKPAISFSAAQTVFCPGVPLQFNDSSASSIVSYAWNFGDGGTGTGKNPIHQYAGTDSAYNITLVATDSVGCTDSLTKAKYIAIRSPKPFYAVKDTATLCPPLETKFTFLGKDVDSFYWDFGDGGASTLPKPNHFYNNYGKYTAKLYVTGYGGCVDSANIPITVTDPIATTGLTFSPVQACNNLTTNFNLTPPYATKFTFYFGDGTADTSQNTVFSHFYSLPNVYSPYLFFEDSVGCKIIMGGLGSINVQGAVPLFGVDKKKFCDSGSVYLTDFSQDGTDPIVTRTWDFGDGSPTIVLPKDAQHKYSQPGLYVPTLSVTTAANCTQKFTDTVRVLATPRPIITSAAGVCNDSSISFNGSLLIPPDTAITWKWDLSKGNTSILQNPFIHYPDTGMHHITLEATNSLGCKGDTSKDIMVYPLPAITVSGDTTAVSGGTGITIPLTYSPGIVSYSWTPEANLSCTDCPNPFANPKFTTTYSVRVVDDKGCTSTRNLTLVVTCNNKNFFIPNTFSPNNDGANDRFYPRGTGLNLIQALRIFNRWGELVFEKRNFPANDASYGWDGTFKGKAAATDTYIYMINIICENANVITYKGNITLIR